MKFRVLFSVSKKTVAAALVAATLFDVGGITIFNLAVLSSHIAQAAPATIDSAPSNNTASHFKNGPSEVFIDDQVGYKFYRTGLPDNGKCSYRKTTNGGTSWGSTVVFDSQTDCVGIAVWYDRWTPGDTTGNYIHLVTIDTSADEMYYNRLDTSSDTLLVATSISIAPGAAGTYAATTNKPNVTKATDGTIYAVTDDGNGTNIRSCSATCGVSGNWSAVGTPPQGNANTYSQLMPLGSGNIMLVNRSVTNVMRSSIWNGSSWSSMSTIDPSAPRNTTYDAAFALTVDTSTGDLFLVYVADNDSFTVDDHDIRSAYYDGSSWSLKTDAITNIAGRAILQARISRDQNNGDLYVIYTSRTTIADSTTGNVYFKKSTNNMTSWGSEQGPINSVAGDLYGIDANLMSYERIHASWFNNNPGVLDMIGETVADIGPDVILDAIGTQKSETRANIIGTYIGGSFSLSGRATRDLTAMVISEKGTIDAQTNLKNIKLFYESDTSFPYDCTSESYSGAETQFGSTVTNGFSGLNGSASFTNFPVSFGSTESLCFYPVMDVTAGAANGQTIDIEVSSPGTDVVVIGATAYPNSAVTLPGTTTVVGPNLTQFAFHWRNDDGSETGATSATAGVQNTSLSSVQVGAPRRVRVGVANQGSTTTIPSTYRLEYGESAPTCNDISSWSVVGNAGSLWEMSDSLNLVDGSDTTNIATTNGGVTDLGGTTFINSNAAVRDSTSTISSLQLDINQSLELEYSIVASSTVNEGATYCFRVTQAGTPLGAYTEYPKATIAADVMVQGVGSHTATTSILATNVYAGGTFIIKENSSSRQVTDITLTEQGTVDGAVGLSNVRLLYDVDTTAPLNCSSESYSGAEAQFGATSNDGFSGVGETITFSDSITISTANSLCLYAVYDVSGAAQNSETIAIAINSPTSDVTVNGGGSVGPSAPATLTGSTTIQGAILEQLAYHWRNDNGSETGATSATGNAQNSPLTDFSLNTPVRLRFSVANAGSVSSVPARYNLEYAPQITTCDAATVWTSVDAAADGWDMHDSTYLTNGETTTNIPIANGGVTDGTGSFIVANGNVRDNSAASATTSLSATEYVDFEYSITSTGFTSYNTTYCFRLSSAGTPLQTYDNYATLTTTPKRDFKVQRGSVQLSGTGQTLVAGVDYVAPASTSSAFVRITNTNFTGAGKDSGGGVQNADDTTVYISNTTNLKTGFTLSRPAAATANTRVDWEIIEFIGSPGTDNEMIVRQVGGLNLSSVSLTATATALGTVGDNSKVVVFITGAANQNASRNYYASQFTSAWSAASHQAVFTRAATGGSAADVSYAVVEFTGLNWQVQRVEHHYSAAGVTETEAITSVNSRDHAFMQAQKRVGATTNVVHYGHTVSLSSVGFVSFRLQAGASVAVEQTSVAWIIENLQTSLGAMNVQRSSGSTLNGVEPRSESITLPISLSALNNTSIMGNSSAAGANTSYPRPTAALTITSTSTYQIWRSDTGTQLDYEVELIEWPVADLSIRQNYYRFYVDNNSLTPTDPWPVGFSDLGENTSITIADEPLGIGDRVRIRMTLKTSNANIPAGLVNFKLQYGQRSSTCSAVGPGSWFDVGQSNTGALWRGYVATGTTDGTSLSTEPPTPGDLLISVANEAGSLVHDSPSVANPYPVSDGNFLEYDWQLEQNGAIPKSTYCFRAVRSDGTPLEGYNNYPQILTAGYTPVTEVWRWYSDPENETPSSPLAAETAAPINIANNDTLALRVSVLEKRNVQGEDIKFKLQFSDDITFAHPVDVVATSSCGGNSLWCYFEGAAEDNELLSTKLLTTSDSCSSGSGFGCGTHNTSPAPALGHLHYAGKAVEYDFTLRNVAARVNTVYYFRLYDVTNGTPVTSGSGYVRPSLVTEGSSLQLTLSGVPSGTTTAGVVTDVSTSPSAIGFGALIFNNEYIAAHRVSVNTNATEGYEVLSFARQQLTGPSGNIIPSVMGTNSAPDSWSSSCSASSTGCIGYHTTDATLSNGSTRFAPLDTYAGLETAPVEIMYSSIPSNDTHDIVYRVRVNEMQPAGVYESEIVYLAVPSY